MSSSAKKTNLGDYVDFQNGYAFKRSEYTEKGHYLIRIKNVQQGFIEINDECFVNIPSDAKFEKFKLKNGDIVVSLTGNVGRIARIREENLPAVLNQRVASVAPKSEEVLSPEYLYYLLRTPEFLEFAIGSGKGAAQQNISTSDMEKYQVSIPSLEKQAEIVEKLDSAFTEIDLLEKNLELRDEKANQLIQSLLSDSYGSNITNTALHQEQSIGEICEVGDGNHSSKYPTKKEMISTGVPFIRAQNIVDGTVDDTDILYISKQKHETLRKGHLNTGDILITNRGEIGKLAIVPPKFQGSNLNSQIAWLRCGKVVRNSYLYYFLKSESARRIFDSGTSGSALQQLTISKLKEIKVPIVSLSDQEAIVKKLDSAFAAVDSLRVQFKKDKSLAASLRQSLLSSAFNVEEAVA